MKKSNNNKDINQDNLNKNIIEIEEEEINYINDDLIEKNNFKVILIQFINAFFLSIFNFIAGFSGSCYLIFVSYYDKFVNNIYIFSRSTPFKERMVSFFKFSFFLVLWTVISFFIIYFYDWIIQNAWGNLFLGFALTFNLFSIPVFLKTLKPALPIYPLGSQLSKNIDEKDKKLNILLFIGSIVLILGLAIMIRFTSSFNGANLPIPSIGGTGITFMPFNANLSNIDEKIWSYLFGGFLSGALFLIPGVSFIIILNIFNVNYDLFNAVRNLIMFGNAEQLPVIIVIFMMFVIGLFSSTLLIKFLNVKKPFLISSIGTGFTIAAVPVVLVSLSDNDWMSMGNNYIPLLIGLIIGFMAVFIFYFINVRNGKMVSKIFKFLNPKNTD